MPASKDFAEELANFVDFDTTMKCRNVKLPPRMPNECNAMSSVIRGIYEGDGSLAFDARNASVVFKITASNMEFLDEIRHYINKYALCKDTNAVDGSVIPYQNRNAKDLKYYGFEKYS